MQVRLFAIVNTKSNFLPPGNQIVKIHGFIEQSPYLDISVAKPQNSREKSRIGHMVVIRLNDNINHGDGADSVYNLVYS